MTTFFILDGKNYYLVLTYPIRLAAGAVLIASALDLCPTFAAES